MRIYEELFIVRPDVTEEEIDAYIEQVKQVITSAGGTIDKVDKWGVRRLAYRVNKRNEGFYTLIQFSAEAATVKEVERRMRVTDLVMKWITVRIDEKLKKLEKRTKQREKRAKRRPVVERPAPTAAMPAAPAASATPGAPMPGAPAPAEAVVAAPAPAEAVVAPAPEAAVVTETQE
ncbi:30S ribosomal protein S6 [Paludibaculum fermentans]|uniref:Small ribosomal subunit protein bS6 n=1 Tax=Paludibaculum fermentans TaxID=1473598 RepID=A0A7S7SN64_PALFE|nr:30S ribosomal protein S6 [Paludibaculum fermentans]QOY89770.1 30S ribosomal protein S6 [Paludibaculum fermentans]